MASNLVVIARFNYRHQAEFAMSYLEDAGVAAAVFADDAGGAHMGLAFSRPARLMVHQENAAEATAMLVDAGFIQDTPD